MIFKNTCGRIAVSITVFFSAQLYSQLVGSGTQIWEKANTSIREASNIKEERLLNFHDGIKNRFLKKYIKHSRDKSHTLSLVHTSKEEEKIWENDAKNIVLNNDLFEKGDQTKVKLDKKPSIFTFTDTGEKNSGKADSIKIRFDDQNLYEMIFIPRKANKTDLNKIHSYLSIKYGISLTKGKYISSDGKLIWDPEKHKEFKYRPTGLGRDDGNELYQKQSSNQEDRFLAIGKGSIFKMNVENPSLFDQNNFVIWSDDNKEMSFKDQENLRILERSWEINFVGTTIPKKDFQVRIDKKKMNPDSLPLAYWMLLKSSMGDITKIPGVEADDYVLFNKVDFIKDNGSELLDHFTFATGPLPKTRDDETGSPVSNPINNELISLNLEDIKLYPNPVKKGQEFTVVFPAMENLSISIYDGGGRLVKMEKIDHKSKSYHGSLGVQSSYLVSLVLGDKVIKTFKLIVD
ncbi:T9SS type A sorting domain-containing protein [Chryseobacterium camelliae]|uniref:T9SS type A sorting domain-containing protein n=1 Tax=Chryseobacterium camelliae TaxID=1265445 RepID=A0ABY7QKK5_9FLAO|nr:T9SS type A sorting domain-containing protein [Chryseobacterium camelliae]WBV60210.1 T9SS type A sorting domain-containing protein [Chryseobacterium camelliae]